MLLSQCSYCTVLPFDTQMSGHYSYIFLPSLKWNFFSLDILKLFIRLEKLCPPDGRKVRMRQEENVSSFQLNSSLVPGHVFNCHLELVLTQPDSGNVNKYISIKNNDGTINSTCKSWIGELLYFMMLQMSLENKLMASWNCATFDWNINIYQYFTL